LVNVHLVYTTTVTYLVIRLMIDFKLINDLTFNTTYSKYVRDTALSVSKDVNDDTLQACALQTILYIHIFIHP